MQKSLSVLLISTVLLTGCSNSRLNPLNWFGRGQEVPVESAEGVNPLIPRKSAFARKDAVYQGQLVGEIRALSVEAVPGGAIARATGLADRQGPFEVKLVALNDGAAENGVLSFELRALQLQNNPTGPDASRLLTAAVFLTDQDLSGVRSIKVLAARNAMSSRR